MPVDPAARTVIHSAVLVDGTIEDDAWIVLLGDTIAGRGRGDDWRAHADDATIIDADGAWLVPGFIDIHVHGGAAAAFDDGGEAIARGLALHRSHGTTRSIVSLVTAAIDRLVPRLEEIAALTETDPLVVGAHLEGPFLDAEFRGAHDPALLRAPDADTVDRLVAAARGTLRQVTLAPELEGATAAIGRFVAGGAAVAVGHTAADYAQTRAAFDAGASILTHAFNGMRGIHHRAPGPVVAAMAEPHVTLELIADGVHVHPDVLRMTFAAAPGRIALVSDAMAAAGAADGSYVLGGLGVEVRDRVARLTDGGSIAGSTLTLDEALRRAVDAGIALPDAVDALSRRPAHAIGRGDDLGALRPGYAADALLLHPSDLRVTRIWAAGEPVTPA